MVSIERLDANNTFVVTARHLSALDLDSLPPDAVGIRLLIEGGIDAHLLEALKTASPRLKSLSVIQSSEIDISAFSGIEWIESLSLNGPYKNELDISTLVNLRRLMLYYSKKFSGWEKTELIEHLSVFAAGSGVVKWISSLKSELKGLTLSQASITGTRIDQLSTVAAIDLRACKVDSVFLDSCIQSHTDTVSCSGTKCYDMASCIHKANNLRILYLDDAGTIPSIGRISRNTIEQFILIGRTLIEDGNLSILEECPKLNNVFFMNNRHYNRRLSDIESMVKERNAFNKPPYPAQVWSLPGEF